MCCQPYSQLQRIGLLGPQAAHVCTIIYECQGPKLGLKQASHARERETSPVPTKPAHSQRDILHLAVSWFPVLRCHG